MDKAARDSLNAERSNMILEVNLECSEQFTRRGRYSAVDVLNCLIPVLALFVIMLNRILPYIMAAQLLRLRQFAGQLLPVGFYHLYVNWQ